jgi:hypothetical protein
MPRLLDRLQFFARLEANGFARRYRNFGAGARIAPNAGFSRPHVEHAEAAELDAVAFGERALHALKHGFDGNFSFGFGDARLGNHFVDDVQLDQGLAPTRKSQNTPTKSLMLREIDEIVNGRRGSVGVAADTASFRGCPTISRSLRKGGTKRNHIAVPTSRSCRGKMRCDSLRSRACQTCCLRAPAPVVGHRDKCIPFSLGRRRKCYFHETARSGGQRGSTIVRFCEISSVRT